MALQKSPSQKQPAIAKRTDADNVTAAKSLSIPAWLNAPLPQFYDLELAKAMVKEGHYSSLDKAYIEIPESRKTELRDQSSQYYKTTHSVNFWQNAPLPSSPREKK